MNIRRSLARLYCITTCTFSTFLAAFAHALEHFFLVAVRLIRPVAVRQTAFQARMPISVPVRYLVNEHLHVLLTHTHIRTHTHCSVLCFSLCEPNRVPLPCT